MQSKPIIRGSTKKHKVSFKASSYGFFLYVGFIWLWIMFVLERNFFDTNSSAYFSLISVVFFVAYLVFLYKRSTIHFLLSFYPLYYFFSLFISSLFINFGIPMLEIDKVGRSNGGVWITLIFLFITIEFSYLAFRRLNNLRFEKVCLKMPQWFDKAFSISVVMFVLLISVFIFFRYSSPLMLGVDRVTFFKEVVADSLTWVPTVAKQFAFFCFFYLLAYKSRLNQIFGHALVLSYFLVTVFVLGDKFSAFILFAVYFFSLYACMSDSPRLGRKQMLILFVGFLFLSSLVLVNYVFVSNYGAGFVFVRIALQGQLLWAVLSEPVSSLIIPQFPSCYIGCGSFENGKDFISEFFLPTDLYLFYKESGSELSGFMPALGIFTMGLPGAILLSIAAAILMGMLQAVFFRFTGTKNLLPSFLAMKALLGVTLMNLSALNTAVPGVILAIMLIMTWGMVTHSTKGNF